ncbi:MAG: ketoacyl-ACP synthase III [Bacteroidales bacterium]|nr:ketoacyl-ACP synthase III [Bacteroidales bacterium]
MKIIGTGSALPSLAVTNNDLASFLDTSDEWITERTGIKERRLLSTETLYDLAEEAALKALKASGLRGDQLDFIICSNVANRFITPGMNCILQEKIGAKCAGLDINVACAGFINALMLADSMMQAGRAQHILIICAEEPSKYCNWDERDTSILFADGAGAVVLAAGDGFKSVHLSMTSNKDVLYYERCMEKTPFEKNRKEGQPLVMRGREVFRMAVSQSTKDLKVALAEAGLKPSDVTYYLMHQANKRIIESVRTLLDEPEEKFPTNIEKYGNTSSASIPILLDEMLAAGKIHKGDILAMSAFGAGFVSAACVMQWMY